jgi:hypothetical protein
MKHKLIIINITKLDDPDKDIVKALDESAAEGWHLVSHSWFAIGGETFMSVILRTSP